MAIVDGLADRVEPSRETFAYGPGKWSVRELLGHVNDGERVFAYRALTFSRFDAVSLPGFDEVTWTPHGHSPRCRCDGSPTSSSLLRRANLEMLRRLDDAQWQAGGKGDNKPITVRALAYVMAGHVRHHLQRPARPLRSQRRPAELGRVVLTIRSLITNITNAHGGR